MRKRINDESALKQLSKGGAPMGEFLSIIPANEFIDFDDHGENLRRNSQIGRDLWPIFLKVSVMEGQDVEMTMEVIKAIQEYKILVDWVQNDLESIIEDLSDLVEHAEDYSEEEYILQAKVRSDLICNYR
ncbi:hypothetical protein [Sporomusa sp. KB1]|uniref:hypothetical protein n=1 Tax=Sporomusa sp. KB1 TaxID=943346 RepID=UPI0011A709F5|nr:hypothetical protein [Sporomusa sp. KB1]TWH45164.1 hypothetical protein Salpa_1067 [Sporomusa sp. KB1]